MQISLVSIVVPLYNEEEFIGTLLKRVLDAPLPDGVGCEIVVVDDASTDESPEIVAAMAAQHPRDIRLVRHTQNRGKGAAIRTAIEHIRGEVCIIQDADLEYDPRDYVRLLQPLLEDKADVVYGSRFLVSGERRVLYYWHSLANRILTTMCNIVADLNLSDMETCYKAFRTPLLRSIPIRSDRFGVEPELTIKLARRQARIYETPVSYHGRTYEDGKKIQWWDAIEAIWIILRYSFSRDIYKGSGPDILDALSGTPRFNNWMAETIRPYLGQQVLEIGAGIGNLTRQLARRRRRYIAADIDPEHLARLRSRFQNRPNIQIRICDLTSPNDFEPLAGQMDSVVCLNVLEHVEDDLLALRNIRSALSPGGRAVILVPHGQGIYGTLDIALGHWRRYDHHGLGRRLEDAGFHLERIVEFNRISWPGWFCTGRLLKRSNLSRLQLRVFDRFVWLWRRIDRLLPWPPVSIIGIGVKKD